MTTPEDELPRWAPDELLVPAILAGSPTTMADLELADRAWVVLQLRDLGHTAEQIKDRLDCSLRLVRAIAADPLGQVMRRYLDENETFAREVGMSAAEVRRLAIALREAERDRDRYHDQLIRMLDRFVTGECGPTFPKCGHPKTRYNTYEAPKTGKLNCRTCHAERQSEYRARKAGNQGSGGGRDGQRTRLTLAG